MFDQMKSVSHISRSCWMDVHSCHFVARPDLSLVPAQYTNTTRWHADKHSIRASRHEQLALYVFMIIRYSFRRRWVLKIQFIPLRHLLCILRKGWITSKTLVYPIKQNYYKYNYPCYSPTYTHARLIRHTVQQNKISTRKRNEGKQSYEISMGY
jgi:hypothetical protein